MVVTTNAGSFKNPAPTSLEYSAIGYSATGIVSRAARQVTIAEITDGGFRRALPTGRCRSAHLDDRHQAAAALHLDVVVRGVVRDVAVDQPLAGFRAVQTTS